MSGFNPYSHGCTRLLCPGCEWVRQHGTTNRQARNIQPAAKTATEVPKKQQPTIPTRDAVVIFFQIAALYLAVFVIIPWMLQTW